MTERCRENLSLWVVVLSVVVMIITAVVLWPATTNYSYTIHNFKFNCSNNYTLHAGDDNIVWFYLSQDEREKMDFLYNEDYDWGFKLQSEAKIVKVEAYHHDYATGEDILLAEMDANRNVVSLNPLPSGKDCVDFFAVYLLHKGEIHRMNFVRSGQ